MNVLGGGALAGPWKVARKIPLRWGRRRRDLNGEQALAKQKVGTAGTCQAKTQDMCCSDSTQGRSVWIDLSSRDLRSVYSRRNCRVRLLARGELEAEVFFQVISQVSALI